MVYKACNEAYNFRKFKTICVFGNEIRNNIIDMSMANDEQNQLLRYINKLKVRQNPRDIKILGWSPVGSVLPHGEKVPL